MVYGTLITCCVGGLTSYHSKLACNNETTNEEIRGKYGGALGNPYDKGCKDNCGEFCFKYKSRVLAEEDYDLESQSKKEPMVFLFKKKDPVEPADD